MESAIDLQLFSSKKKAKPVKLDVPPQDAEESKPRPPRLVTSMQSGSSGLIDSVAWEKAFVDLENRLKPFNLSIHKVDADGNCLFRSVAYLLNGSEDAHASLRKEAVTYILRNEDFFAPFMDEGMTVLSYCAQMSKPETWGGQPELQALSLLYNVNLYIFQTDNDPAIEMSNFPEDGKCLILSYHQGNHYNAVISHDPLSLSSLKRLMLPPPPPPPPPQVPIQPKKKSLFNK